MVVGASRDADTDGFGDANTRSGLDPDCE